MSCLPPLPTLDFLGISFSFSLGLPEIPDTFLPNIPSLDLELPSIDLPTIVPPSFSLSLSLFPSFSIPDTFLPNIPSLDLELPSIDLPTIPLPTFSFGIDLNALLSLKGLPSLPDFSLPSLQCPDSVKESF